MKYAVFVILSAATLVVSGGAHADSGLKGTTMFSLIMEPLDQDAVTCGVALDDILTAAKYPIAASQIRLTELVPPFAPILIINVTLLPTSGDCVFGVTLSATASAQTKLPWESVGMFRAVQLWRTTRIGIAPRSKARDAVKTAIDEAAKKFVIEWTAQNK